MFDKLPARLWFVNLGAVVFAFAVKSQCRDIYREFIRWPNPTVFSPETFSAFTHLVGVLNWVAIIAGLLALIDLLPFPRLVLACSSFALIGSALFGGSAIIGTVTLGHTRPMWMEMNKSFLFARRGAVLGALVGLCVGLTSELLSHSASRKSHARERDVLPLLLLTLLLASCSMTVPAERVYGTYIASYPFGTETLTLNRDGTFVQSVAIHGQNPVTVHGTWEFDREKSRATFHNSMIVVDGFDQLRPDWRAVSDGIVSMGVERHWFRILIGSSAAYPYVKQWK